MKKIILKINLNDIFIRIKINSANIYVYLIIVFIFQSYEIKYIIENIIIYK